MSMAAPQAQCQKFQYRNSCRPSSDRSLRCLPLCAVQFAVVLVLLGFFSGVAAQSSDIQAELQAKIAIAEEFEAKEQFYNAIELWQLVLRETPNSSRAYFGIARSYMRLGRYKEALGFVEKASLLDNQNYRVGILKARIFMGLRRYSEARDLLLQLKQQSTSYEIDLALAEIYAVLGDLASSINYLSSIQEFAADDLNYLLGSVMVYEEAGQQEKASRFLRQAQDLYYNEAVVHKVAADYYLRQGSYAKVQEAVDIVKRLGIDTVGLRSLALEAAYLKGDYQLTINLAETIVSLYPKNSEAWYLLGLAYNNNAEYSRALEALTTARRIAPDDELVSIVISEILRLRYPYPSKWHSEEAVHYIEQAKVKRRNLRYNEALQDYRLALQLDPLNKTNWMAFANVFRDRGNYAKYLDRLRTWRQFGIAPSEESREELDRLIEIYAASQEQGVAQNWGIDQYSYANNFYPMRIFVIKSRSFDYIGAPPELSSYFMNILQWYPQPTVIGEVQLVDDLLKAQQAAYNSKNSDYYATLEFTKQGENFRAELNLYLSSSGWQIASFTVEQVRKGKIYNAFVPMAQQLNSLFPKRGQLVQVTLNKAVISQGSLDGVEVGQKWLIFREEALDLSVDRPFAEYDASQVLGVLTIEKIDEKVSEGTVELKSIIKPVRSGYIALQVDAEAIMEGNKPDEPEKQLNQSWLLQEPNIGLQKRLFELA